MHLTNIHVCVQALPQVLFITSASSYSAACQVIRQHAGKEAEAEADPTILLGNSKQLGFEFLQLLGLTCDVGDSFSWASGTAPLEGSAAEGRCLAKG